jgi:hypothetical protein
MKQKKKDKEKESIKVEENVKADLEKFIQAFESLLTYFYGFQVLECSLSAFIFAK